MFILKLGCSCDILDRLALPTQVDEPLTAFISDVTQFVTGKSLQTRFSTSESHLLQISVVSNLSIYV